MCTKLTATEALPSLGPGVRSAASPGGYHGRAPGRLAPTVRRPVSARAKLAAELRPPHRPSPARPPSTTGVGFLTPVFVSKARRLACVFLECHEIVLENVSLPEPVLVLK